MPAAGPPLTDSRLPRLALALDGEHVGRLLAAELTRSGSELELLGCRLERFRYRPGSRLTTLYDVRLRNGTGSTRWRHWVSGLMTADDRISREHERLCRRAPPRALAALPDPRPMLADSPRLLLRHFPSDRRLEHADAVLSGVPAPLAALYRSAFGDAGGPNAVDRPQPVRYRPDISVVFRQRIRRPAPAGAGAAWEVYLKMRADDGGLESYRRQRLLYDHAGCLGLIPARPLGYLPELRLQAELAVSGATLEEQVCAGRQEPAQWQQLAEALATFHCADVRLDRVIDWHLRVARARSDAALIGWACPPLRSVLREVLDRLAACDGIGAGWLCHGDLKPDHLFYGDDGIRVIDLEDVALSNPMFDVARLLARLELLAVRGRTDVAALQASAAFLDAYLARVPLAWGRPLAPHYACAALDMARFCIQHQMSGWVACSRHFCERAHDALGRPGWAFHDRLSPPWLDAGFVSAAQSADADGLPADGGFLASRAQAPARAPSAPWISPTRNSSQ